jgi:signal transduction histidine kinase
MSTVKIPEVRERTTRWLEDGQTQLGLIRWLLDDYEQLQGVAEAAERECERLGGLLHEAERLRSQLETAEHESEQLRDTIGQLRSAAERDAREREEIAASLSHLVNEVLLRVRGETG